MDCHACAQNFEQLKGWALRDKILRSFLWYRFMVCVNVRKIISSNLSRVLDIRIQSKESFQGISKQGPHMKTHTWVALHTQWLRTTCRLKFPIPPYPSHRTYPFPLFCPFTPFRVSMDKVSAFPKELRVISMFLMGCQKAFQSFNTLNFQSLGFSA